MSNSDDYPLIKPCQSKGISLIELLLVISISLFLLSGVLHLYLVHKKFYDYLQGLARLQENMRTALHFLQTDIRMAGYLGGIKLNFPIVFKQHVLLSPENAILSDSADPNLYHPSNKIFGTDGIVIRKLSNRLLNVKVISNQLIQIASTVNFKENDILLLADCSNAEIVQVQGLIFPDKLRLMNTLQHNYLHFAQLGRLQAIYYYLGWTVRHNSAKQIIPALYRIDLLAQDAKPTEIVEGIEDMQIHYNTSFAEYITLNKDANINWQTVKGVHISLLINSIEPCVEKNLSLLAGKLILVSDRLLHKSCYTYIALRERFSP